MSRSRTTPAWVRSRSEDDEFFEKLVQAPEPVARPRPSLPSAPSPPEKPPPDENAPRGKKWDKQRESTPVIITRPFQHDASRWRAFAEASAPRGGPKGTIVEQLPEKGIPRPYQNVATSDVEKEGFLWFLSTTGRTDAMRRLNRMMLKKAATPLLFRVLIFCLATIALALSGSIVHLTRDCHRGSSTWLALIVDAVAIPYTFYMFYDEGRSKPLGLRSPWVKLRLVLLDLLFVIFSAANLSLALDACFDTRWACSADDSEGADFHACPRIDKVCNAQYGLTSILFFLLVTYGLGLCVNLSRLVWHISNV